MEEGLSSVEYPSCLKVFSSEHLAFMESTYACLSASTCSSFRKPSTRRFCRVLMSLKSINSVISKFRMSILLRSISEKVRLLL